MSIEQLTDLEHCFAKNLQDIRHHCSDMSKSHRLRIGAWLKKLCSVVDNVFWRKNRNLYSEVLAIMTAHDRFEHPFDKAPIQGSLPKLNAYQIPYWIRNKLEERVGKENRHNVSNLQNVSTDREPQHFQSQKMCRLRGQKKQSWQLKSLQTPLDTSIALSPAPGKLNGDRGSQLLDCIERSLYFLAKHNQRFVSNEEYCEVVGEIVRFGDRVGQHYRQMKYSILDNQ